MRQHKRTHSFTLYTLIHCQFTCVNTASVSQEVTIWWTIIGLGPDRISRKNTFNVWSFLVKIQYNLYDGPTIKQGLPGLSFSFTLSRDLLKNESGMILWRYSVKPRFKIIYKEIYKKQEKIRLLKIIYPPVEEVQAPFGPKYFSRRPHNTMSVQLFLGSKWPCKIFQKSLSCSPNFVKF